MRQAVPLVLVLICGSCAAEPQSALLQAQARHDPKAVEAALAAGASAADKVEALRLQSVIGSHEIIGLLLKAGADPQQGLTTAACIRASRSRQAAA